MKKLVGVLLVFIMTLLLAFPTLAESTEVQGKALDQMLPMYYWMLGRIRDEMPHGDQWVSLNKESGSILFGSTYMGGRTFSNSKIIKRADLVFFDKEYFKDSLQDHTTALIFAMEYSFEDLMFVQDPFATISEELAPIVSAVLAGETYVSDPYVYYLDRSESSLIGVFADHIDLYKSEHPEFSK